jgi:hypothetical protein
MSGLPHQVLHAKKMNEEGKKFKPVFGIEAYFIDDLEKWKVEKEEHLANQKKKKKKEANGPSLRMSLHLSVPLNTSLTAERTLFF